MINCKVTPVKECPMCGDENIRLIDICPIHNSEHKICKQCINNLKDKYKKKFCAYCGERPDIIEQRQDSINFTIESETQLNRTKYRYIIYILGIILCYIGLILNWHLYKMINHYLENDEKMEEKIDWHIYNALYALIMNICIIFFIVNMCENKCNK